MKFTVLAEDKFKIIATIFFDEVSKFWEHRAHKLLLIAIEALYTKIQFFDESESLDEPVYVSNMFFHSLLHNYLDT